MLGGWIRVAGDAGDAAEIRKELRIARPRVDVDATAVDAGPSRAPFALEALGELAAAALTVVAGAFGVPSGPEYHWQSKPVCVSICQTQHADKLALLKICSGGWPPGDG